MARDKEMKESLAKFREEAQKLEETEALKKARQKFENIEAETTKGFDVVKEKLSKTFEEAQKTEFARKGREVTEGFAKQAKAAAETIGKATDKIGDVPGLKTIEKGVEMVKQEVVEDGVYRPPVKLRKRKENSDFMSERVVEANESATGVELHKDSAWSTSWQNFRDNNAYVNKLFDWKAKFDESDNTFARGARLVTHKVSDLFGNMFQRNQLSEVLTEICKMDPTFDKFTFLKECEKDIIPNILEAIIRGDLEILQDWCHEGLYNILATPIKQAQSMGYKFDSKILEIMNVDLAIGKMMDQGPVLVITFQTQQVDVVRNAKGEVVEGDPEKIFRMDYVWVLCRDQNELDPKAAWRLLEMAATSNQQYI